MACGVFGIRDEKASVFPYINLALIAQNTRGHQSYGYATFDGKFNVHRDLGLVPDLGREEIKNWTEKLPGHTGIGSVRYSTSGGTDKQSLIEGTQPIIKENENMKLALVFNGNVSNPAKVFEGIKKDSPGYSYPSCDLGLICKELYTTYKRENSLEEAVKTCMNNIDGAFSIAGMNQNGELFAFKDPYGIRPLCCGHNKSQNIHAVSSESVGLDINSIKFDFELEPGELVTLSKDDFEREQLVPCKGRALCAFEFAYFARPDSKFGEKYSYEVREEFGRNLARDNPEIVKDLDIIISMPETGDDATYGFHEESGIRWERASRRHRYKTKRAFILLPEERYLTITQKINILGSKVRGKKIGVIDDSIVRSDTTRANVERLELMGAKKVYVFITFPRITNPCFYGIDMATYGELIGAKYEPPEIAEITGANGVFYQSIKNFVKATGHRRDELCLGCVTGKYPTPEAQKIADEKRKLFEEGKEEKGRRIYEPRFVKRN